MSAQNNKEHDKKVSVSGKTILIVDDEPDIRTLIRGILEDDGYTVREAGGSTQAYTAVEKNPPDLVILDIWLQGSDEDGLQILEKLQQDMPDLPVIMISGHGTIETAVSAIRVGAYDFIEKPFKTDRLLVMIKRALEVSELKRENQVLKSSQSSAQEFDFIGESETVKKLRDVIARVAPTNSRVLISGAPGTGKNLAARMIYRQSARADEPFIILNCATLHPDRFEIELFGQEEPSVIPGLLEKADGGTLLLDEVADMPLETQGKIMRVLQGQSFHRLGGKKSIQVDVRIIASTNRNLEQEIETGNFRQDLYYRLNVVPIVMPELRQYPQDIPLLCASFISVMGGQFGIKDVSFLGDSMKCMMRYAWPGNARQLRNVIEWILIMHGGDIAGGISVAHLPPEISGTADKKSEEDNHSGYSISGNVGDGFDETLSAMDLRNAREEFERRYLQAQMIRFEGNVSKMSEFVGMERTALHRKLKSLNITLDAAAESPAPKKTTTGRTS